MTETLRGYDAWLTNEPEPWSYGECDVCGYELLDEGDIFEFSSNTGHAQCLFRYVEPCTDCRKARCICVS